MNRIAHLIAVLVLQRRDVRRARVPVVLQRLGLIRVAGLDPLHLLCAVLADAVHLLRVVLAQSLQLLALVVLDAVEHRVDLLGPRRFVAQAARAAVDGAHVQDAVAERRQSGRRRRRTITTGRAKGVKMCEYVREQSTWHAPNWRSNRKTHITKHATTSGYAGFS